MSSWEDSDGINGSGNCAPCFALEQAAWEATILEINTDATETNFSLTATRSRHEYETVQRLDAEQLSAKILTCRSTAI